MRRLTFAVSKLRHNAHGRAPTSAQTVETEMKTLLLTFALIAVAAPSHAAQNTSHEKKCHEMVGKEVREGTGENSRVGQLQVQRFSECMRGVPQ